jgi:hypothetical protein
MFEKTLLAMDRSLFEKFEGLSVSLREPEKHSGNPVLSPGPSGSPDSLRAQYDGTVLFHNGLHRLWYLAFDWENNEWISRVAYAESRDGSTWEKPRLGLTEYRGSKANNLVSGLQENPDCISVIKDDDGLLKAAVTNFHGLEKRHTDKKFHEHWDSKCGSPAFMGIAESRDGLSWSFSGRGDPEIREKLETCRLFKINGVYYMSGQQLFPWAGSEWNGRVVSFFRSENLREWVKLDNIYRNKTCQCHVAVTFLKKTGDTLLGLVGRFQDAPEMPDQHFEIGLVISHDGVNWEEPAPCQSFIRRGGAGQWDAGGVIHGDGLIERDGLCHIFYSGSAIGNDVLSGVGIGKVTFPENRYGYAALQVKWDIGFKGVRAGGLVTKTVRPPSGSEFALLLNADNFAGDALIRAAVLDENGNVLKGYSFDDFSEIKKEGASIKCEWKTAGPVIKTDKPFKIAVNLYGGTYRMQSPFLYALKIIEIK